MAAARSNLFNVYPRMPRAPQIKYHDVIPAGVEIEPKTDHAHGNLHNEECTKRGTVEAQFGGLKCDETLGGLKVNGVLPIP